MKFLRRVFLLVFVMLALCILPAKADTRVITGNGGVLTGVMPNTDIVIQGCTVYLGNTYSAQLVCNNLTLSNAKLIPYPNAIVSGNIIVNGTLTMTNSDIGIAEDGPQKQLTKVTVREEPDVDFHRISNNELCWDTISTYAVYTRQGFPIKTNRLIMNNSHIYITAGNIEYRRYYEGNPDYPIQVTKQSLPLETGDDYSTGLIVSSTFQTDQASTISIKDFAVSFNANGFNRTCATCGYKYTYHAYPMGGNIKNGRLPSITGGIHATGNITVPNFVPTAVSNVNGSVSCTTWNPKVPVSVTGSVTIARGTIPEIPTSIGGNCSFPGDFISNGVVSIKGTTTTQGKAVLNGYSGGGLVASGSVEMENCSVGGVKCV